MSVIINNDNDLHVSCQILEQRWEWPSELQQNRIGREELYLELEAFLSEIYSVACPRNFILRLTILTGREDHKQQVEDIQVEGQLSACWAFAWSHKRTQIPLSARWIPKPIKVGMAVNSWSPATFAFLLRCSWPHHPLELLDYGLYFSCCCEQYMQFVPVTKWLHQDLEYLTDRISWKKRQKSSPWLWPHVWILRVCLLVVLKAWVLKKRHSRESVGKGSPGFCFTLPSRMY